MRRRVADGTYVWGWPRLTVHDAPNGTNRLVFAVRLQLFRIARRFAYTRRGLTVAWAVTTCLSVGSGLIVLSVTESPGWAVVTAALIPVLLLTVLRHRVIRVRRPSGPPSGVREPRRPPEPSGDEMLSRPLA